MVQGIERYLKQAIVDRHHAVASAALFSSYVRKTLNLLFFVHSTFTLSFLCFFVLLLSPYYCSFGSPHPSQHLCNRGSGEVVKRWVNEVQEALSSDSLMVQYHAMGLLYHLRKKDRLAISKMVTKQVRSSLRSPHGYCLLIRIASKVLEDEVRGASGMLYDFLETCLRHKNEVGV